MVESRMHSRLRRVLALIFVFVAFVPTFAQDASPDQTPPKLIKRVLPKVPRHLEGSGLRAVIVFEFEIDAKGRVQNPTVRESTHPELNKPALDAVLKWEFEPAKIGGTPVHLKNVRQSIHFLIADGGKKGR